MPAKPNKGAGARTAEITVVVVRPPAPKAAVLDTVYQIVAASKTAYQ